MTRSVAIGALGTLSLVQWGRKLQLQGPDFVLYLFVECASQRISRHRDSVRLAQHLGGSEANRKLSICTSHLHYPPSICRNRADYLGVHAALEPLTLFRLSRYWCNHIWSFCSLAPFCFGNAKRQCNSSLTIHSFSHHRFAANVMNQAFL